MEAQANSAGSLEGIAMYVAGNEVQRVAVRADDVRHGEERRKVAPEAADESVIEVRRPLARQRKSVGHKARVHATIEGRAELIAVVEHVGVAVLIASGPMCVR